MSEPIGRLGDPGLLYRCRWVQGQPCPLLDDPQPWRWCQHQTRLEESQAPQDSLVLLAKPQDLQGFPVRAS